MYVHASLPYPSAFSSPSSSSAPWVQVVVRNAGHMTPAFAPRASYEMFERFLRGSRKGIIFLSTNSRILFVVPSQLVFQSAHAVSISTESTPSGHAPRPNARLDTTSSPVMFASTPPPPLSCSPRHHLLPCHVRLDTTSSPVMFASAPRPPLSSGLSFDKKDNDRVALPRCAQCGGAGPFAGKALPQCNKKSI